MSLLFTLFPIHQRTFAFPFYWSQMRVKDLVRWVDSFGLPCAPWAVEAADWATVLNLLSRLLHQQLAERVETEERRRRRKSVQTEEEGMERQKQQQGEEGDEEQGESSSRRESASSSRHHPSTQLPFQQALHLAECALGAPQLTVLADTKTGAEVDNQLALFVTLCSLRFAMGATETKPFRDFQFSFRIYFDMDSDESSRFCASCGALVHHIERSIFDGHVWHRSCLKCAICGRQLYRGAFHCPSGDGMAFECVEHFANRVLFDDPMHRLALPPSRHSVVQSSTPAEKRLSMLSVASSATPPPRPPPPKAANPGQKMQMQNERAAEQRESIERQIASATAARHDAPTPKPRATKADGTKFGRAEGNASSSRGTEKDTSTYCWEVLKYPEELNPFGSEDEADDQPQQNNPFGEDDSASSSGESELIDPSNGGKTATQPTKNAMEMAKRADNGEEEEEEPEEVHNPQDRVQSAADEESSSACPSPARAQMVKIVTAGSPTETSAEEEHPLTQVANTSPTADGEDTTPKREDSSNKMPNNERGQLRAQETETQYQFNYIPPLAPMLFRPVSSVQLRKFDASRLLTPSGDDLSKQYQQQLQHLYELDTRLRKLHAQLDQWEITGARLEGQLLREMGNKEKSVWRKGGTKLANEYTYVVEQRLTALSLEAQLVRRYMNTFLEVAHAELDSQMEAVERGGVNVSDGRRDLFGALLAQLLHMRNELTELERRDRNRRTDAAEEREKTEKATKSEVKRKKEESTMEEGTDKRDDAEEKCHSVSEAAEKVPSTTAEQQQKKRTMLKMRGVKQSLVNTLRKKL